MKELPVDYNKSQFRSVRKITWSDVIDKISNEFSVGSHLVLNGPFSLPTFVLHNSYYPKSILSAFNEVKRTTNVNVMHMYISFVEHSDTFGRHADSEDVMIVQSVGSVSYGLDDGRTLRLDPGDSLFIPKGVYHSPITHGPRVTLSFSW
jgi:mannose-6-phosphate isomerase-like protein (cupin superfamily)